MPGAPSIPRRPTSILSVLDPSVFKAYDVRGIYPSQLDEDGAYRVARAYTAHFEPRSVALGQDMRLSSPSMTRAAAEGITDAGADVVELGLVGTEMLYHAVTELGLDGGICVTASHNPKEYTGMKIVRRGALPVGGDSGLAEIRVLAESGFHDVTSRGSIRSEDVWLSFVQKVLSFVDLDAIRPLRVVIDAANGMAGVMLAPVLEKLPQLDLVRCFFDPDGSFRMSILGVSFGTSRTVSPLCFDASASERTSIAMITLRAAAPEHQSFWPLIDQPSLVCSARVRVLAASEPDEGSEIEMEKRMSPRM